MNDGKQMCSNREWEIQPIGAGYRSCRQGGEWRKRWKLKDRRWRQVRETIFLPSEANAVEPMKREEGIWELFIMKLKFRSCILKKLQSGSPTGFFRKTNCRVAAISTSKCLVTACLYETCNGGSSVSTLVCVFIAVFSISTFLSSWKAIQSHCEWVIFVPL